MSETTRQDRERLRELLARVPQIGPEAEMRQALRAAGCYPDDAELAAGAVAHLTGLLDAADERDRIVAAVESALGVYRVAGGVSCGGPTVDSPGCFAADLADRVRRAILATTDTAAAGDAEVGA